LVTLFPPAQDKEWSSALETPGEPFGDSKAIIAVVKNQHRAPHRADDCPLDTAKLPSTPAATHVDPQDNGRLPALWIAFALEIAGHLRTFAQSIAILALRA
jgi:hypothetical protein